MEQLPGPQRPFPVRLRRRKGVAVTAQKPAAPTQRNKSCCGRVGRAGAGGWERGFHPGAAQNRERMRFSNKLRPQQPNLCMQLAVRAGS